MRPEKDGETWHGKGATGQRGYFLPEQVYAGYKDLNEAQVATKRIDIGTWGNPSVIPRRLQVETVMEKALR